MVNRDLATEVTSKDVYIAHNPVHPRFRVNLIDGGCKQNIIRLLQEANCLVRCTN